MYTISGNEALKKVGSNIQGLKENQIEEKRKKYGENALREQKKETIAHKFLMQFKNLMVIVLLISAVISITLALVKKQYADLFEGGVILFIVFLNATIGVFQEKKADNALEALNQKMEPYSKVLRDGKLKTIKSRDLVVGDIVSLSSGDVVPADIRLLETHSLKCNESSITGESKQVLKNENLVLHNGVGLSDRKNMAFSGSVVTYGHGMGVVVAVGENSELGKIAKMIDVKTKQMTPLEKSISKIGKVTSISILVIAVVIFIIEIFFAHTADIMNAFLVSVALAVAAIPESLPAVITIIMALGVQRLAKQKAIVKKLNAVETLGSCTVICSDKTGTITKNKLTVEKFFLNNKFAMPTSTTKEGECMLQCMSLCNNVFVNNDGLVGNNSEVALVEYLKNDGINIRDMVKKYPRVNEIPFDSNRKMMSTVNHVHDKDVVFTKGAFDSVLKLCTHIMLDGKKVLLKQEHRLLLERANREMGEEALRVLAVAVKELDGDEIESHLTFVGMVGMTDPPRPEVADAISKCFKAGLKPIMITGDHKETAFAIAKRVGIANSRKQILTGEELSQMSDEKLKREISNYTVFARVVPEHKVRIVQAFQSLGNIVAMTGDGVNDAPSIKMADIGVGMGQSGTEVTKMVSDLIISDDNFATIVIAVEEGRKVYSNIGKAVQFLLGTNAVEVMSMLIAILTLPNATFLLPAQILFINLVTDSLPAFALGMEKSDAETMSRPPRKPNSHLLSGSIGTAVIYQSFIQTAIVVFVFVLGLHWFGNAVATTMAFYTIIYMQWLHSINCKTNKSIFKVNVFNNMTFNICFLITLALNLIVSVFPFMLTLFGLSPLNFTQWLIVAVASFLILPLVELVKLCLYGGKRKNRLVE